MIEYLIIAVLVLSSAVIVFKKVFPKTSSAAFLSLSEFFQRQGFDRLAKWLKPKMATGCGGGCGCASDDKTAQSSKAPQPVKWR